jgi:hypothetical protein
VSSSLCLAARLHAATPPPQQHQSSSTFFRSLAARTEPRMCRQSCALLPGRQPAQDPAVLSTEARTDLLIVRILRGGLHGNL